MMIICLSGCQSMMKPKTISNFCLISKPMRYNSNVDRAFIVEQMENHNKIGIDACGW